MELDELGVRLDVEARSLLARARDQDARTRCARSRPRCARRRRGSRPGIAALRACRIGRDGWLRRDGRRFTAEDLRAAVNTRIMAEGCVPVAHHLRARRPGRGPARGGARPDPRAHAGGDGHLSRARSGPATSATSRAPWCAAARRDALQRGLRAGARGRAPRPSPRAARAPTGRRSTARSRPCSTARGYRTGMQDGRMQGFFHGTGHGLGLQIHEPPSISARGTDPARRPRGDGGAGPLLPRPRRRAHRGRRPRHRHRLAQPDPRAQGAGDLSTIRVEDAP